MTIKDPEYASDTKKRILLLIERYGRSRSAEELAGQRDSMAAVKRHFDAGKKAWSELGEELDKLLADNDRLRGELTMARAAYESERAKEHDV